MYTQVHMYHCHIRCWTAPSTCACNLLFQYPKLFRPHVIHCPPRVAMVNRWAEARAPIRAGLSLSQSQPLCWLACPSTHGNQSSPCRSHSASRKVAFGCHRRQVIQRTHFEQWGIHHQDVARQIVSHAAVGLYVSAWAQRLRR
jgi:hypothetical protein